MKGGKGQNKIKNPAFDLVPGKSSSIAAISKSFTFTLTILFQTSFATDEVIFTVRKCPYAAKRRYWLVNSLKHQFVFFRPLDNFAYFNDVIIYLVLWIVHILIFFRSVIWLAFNDVQNNHVTQHCCLQREEKNTCHLILSHNTASLFTALYIFSYFYSIAKRTDRGAVRWQTLGRRLTRG